MTVTTQHHLHGFPWHRLYVHLIQVIKKFTSVFDDEGRRVMEW